MVSVHPVLQTQLVSPPPAARLALESRFTVGGVISKTMAAWWRHLPAFTLLSIVVYAPMSVWFVLFFARLQPGSVPEPSFFAAMGMGFLVVWVITIFLSAIQVGAVTFATVRHLQGTRARLAEMTGMGFRRILPVGLTGLLLGLGVIGGGLLLAVPGIMFLVAACVAVPAAVVERPGVLAAFSRSFALTRGNRWGLFAAGLVTLVVVWILALVIQVAATVGLTLALGPERARVAVLAVSQIGNVLFSGIPLVGFAVAYHDLRVAKEGVDTATLASVFE